MIKILSISLNCHMCCGRTSLAVMSEEAFVLSPEGVDTDNLTCMPFSMTKAEILASMKVRMPVSKSPEKDAGDAFARIAVAVEIQSRRVLMLALTSLSASSSMNSQSFNTTTSRVDPSVGDRREECGRWGIFVEIESGPGFRPLNQCQNCIERNGRQGSKESRFDDLGQREDAGPRRHHRCIGGRDVDRRTQLVGIVGTTRKITKTIRTDSLNPSKSQEKQ